MPTLKDIVNNVAPAATKPTTATPAPKAAAPQLSGWGYYLGNEVDQGNTQNKYGQQFLHDIQQYDPNAHWEVANQYGGSDGGATQTMMRLVYDDKKLPGGGAPAMVDMNQGAYAGFRDDPNAGYAGHLFDHDAAITTDPNGYGRVTSPRNMDLASDFYDPWGTYGPMIIAAIATMGAAAPALAARAGLGAFSGGLGAGGAAVSALPGVGRAISSGDYLGAAGSIAGAGLGLGGMPIAGGIASAAVPTYRAAQNGDWLGAALAAAGPAGRAAGVDPLITQAGTSLGRIYRNQQGPKG